MKVLARAVAGGRARAESSPSSSTDEVERHFAFGTCACACTWRSVNEPLPNSARAHHPAAAEAGGGWRTHTPILAALASMSSCARTSGRKGRRERQRENVADGERFRQGLEATRCSSRRAAGRKSQILRGGEDLSA